MKRARVASRVVHSVGYDAESSILEIEFHTGDIYRFLMIPIALYEAFMGADSKGTYFREHIRDKYPFERTRGPIIR